MRHLVAATVTLALAAPALAGDLRIELTDVRNTRGVVILLLFDSAASFEKGDEPHTMLVTRATAKPIRLVLPDFPPGTYAALAIHDENENDDLDTSWTGIPQEGLGFSNAEKGHPDYAYEKVSFPHTREGATRQTIELYYPEVEGARSR